MQIVIRKYSDSETPRQYYLVEMSKYVIRQLSSLDAFFYGKRRGNRIARPLNTVGSATRHAGIVYNFKFVDEFLWERGYLVRSTKRSGSRKLWETFPERMVGMKYCSDIWEFYKLIGYDYKRRAYIGDGLSQ